MEGQLTSEEQVREQVRAALGTVRPLVTMSRDGLVITALEWGAAGQAAYETATAAAAAGDLELREQGSGDVPTIEAVTRTKPVVIFAGDTVVGGKQNRIINITVWLPPRRSRPSRSPAWKSGAGTRGTRSRPRARWTT